MKFKHLSILFVVTLILSACNTNSATEPKEQMGEIYSIALDSFMELDEGLNGEMEYIAIDMSNFEGVDERDKKEIISYFEEKYNVEVMDATLDQLKEDGLFHTDTMSLDGVLLRIEKFDFNSDTTASFEGSKYRSAKGAIGVVGTVQFVDDHWEIKVANITWMS